MLLEKHAVFLRPVLFAVLGILFCFWSLQGNDVNFCATAGCGLYHDTSLGGLSLWWYGIGAFTLLSILPLFASIHVARLAAGTALVADTFLLFLLSVTAPCLNCLVVAAFFALIYRSLRNEQTKEFGKPRRRSILLAVWTFLFVINIWAVFKAELGPWSIAGDTKEATIHLYFSPSCPHCRDALEFYAGSTQTAFFPVAEEDHDIAKVASMRAALAQGTPIDIAAKDTQKVKTWGFFTNLRPDILLLRFRLLTNKAHVFVTGSQGVPYIEYRGIPSLVSKELKKRRKLLEEIEEDLEQSPLQRQSAAPKVQGPSQSHDLDLLLGTETQCIRGKKCP